jgi:ligand-binding SRPBCC domain-containing protein
MAVFEDELWLNCSPEGLFDFLAQPANVEKISDPRMGLKLTSAPDVVTPGCRVVSQVQAFGTVQTLEHEIVQVERPTRILEKLVKGPMKSWVHEHRFEPKDGGVTMLDRVTFDPPGGVLGFLVKESKILEQLEDGFEHRAAALKRLVDSGEIR